MIENDKTDSAIDAEDASPTIESSTQEQEGSPDLLELNKDHVDNSTPKMKQTIIQSETTESVNAIDAEGEEDELQIADRNSILALTSSTDKIMETSEETNKLQ